MRYYLFILILIISASIQAQSKKAFLQANRFDLRSATFDFPQKDFKVIGFGAYHGSAKTEAVENALLTNLTKKGQVQYYIIETDFSTAHYFNEFMKTGDTLLLKNLVKHYGLGIPQDRSIETYKKWKELKYLNEKLSAEKKLTIIGINGIVNYKYPIKHLSSLILNTIPESKTIHALREIVRLDTADYNPNSALYSKKVLQNLITEYEGNKEVFEPFLEDKMLFEHLIRNIKITFDGYDREQLIFENYQNLSKKYHFDTHPQFIRYGFFHLEKSRGSYMNYSSFFTRLIENNVYAHQEIISIIGYLTKSRVLWGVNYDADGKYLSHTTEGGFGIGDYWKEYFKGIKHLKKNKISDLTLFRLNVEGSPYRKGTNDLMLIKLFLKRSNKPVLKGKTTTDFLDYAVLISESKANTPIDKY